MKKIAIVAATLAMGSMSASAADLAARPYTKAPPAPVMVYNWGGFYIGGNVGGAWARRSDPREPLAAWWPWLTTAPARGATSSAAAKWVATGSCRQLRGRPGGHVRLRRHRCSHALPALPGFTSVNSDQTFTVTGRVGYLSSATAGYVKGGGAWREQPTSFSPAAPSSEFASGVDRQGWTIGGGREYDVCARTGRVRRIRLFGFRTQGHGFTTAITGGEFVAERPRNSSSPATSAGAGRCELQVQLWWPGVVAKY